jgi:ribosome-binding factor A
MQNSRMIRIDDEILKELSKIIRGELQDPRIGSMTSVVKVETNSDLSHCKVHVSVFGDDKAKESALQGLTSSQSFIRKQIATRINLRVTPKFQFVLDETLEHGIRMTKLIESVVKTTKKEE